MTLRRRVKGYFEERNLSPHANTEMVVKTIVMVSAYLVPYLLMLLGVISSTPAMLITWAFMGFAVAGIGMCVMHDANHLAYSDNAIVNRNIGYLLNIIGGFVANWKIQHNRLHHSYTNIDHHDEDIAPRLVLRLCPHKKRYGFHRIQHIYGWFLYGFMTIAWITVKDFNRLFKYRESGFLKDKNGQFEILLTKLVFLKIGYYGLFLVLPIMLIPVAWWITALGFFFMHFVAGLTLAVVFQLAHVMPTSEYPLPNEQGSMENNWAIHQMITTTNFSPNNRAFSWYLGGLNFQIEHHLFPQICHVHYRNISPIVKQTAEEFGIPYFVQPTFVKALGQHKEMLKKLGRFDEIPAVHSPALTVG
ncbi:MAG: acyl-CoA desaturase [Bacteroidota bacterium]